ncbi:MAG: S8 family serine peptidase [Deltaproteobacteria bacterium]|nr:S8 family serine peptidase [Deltaproteobacteria bacterium]
MMSIYTKVLMALILLLLLYFISCSNAGETDPYEEQSVTAVTFALSDLRTDIATRAWASVQTKPVPDRYIVMLKPDADAEEVAQREALKPSAIYKHVINGFAATVPQQALAGISKNPNVISITPVRAVQALGQQVPSGISRIGGPVSVSVDVAIAVVDTGITRGHADLNVVARTDCSSQDKKDKVCVKDTGDDVYGHGTHVAGIAAAIDNDIDVVGVAPGAPLYSVKVLDDHGNGTTETLIKGLDWVAARADQIRVANLSIGGACSNNEQMIECDDAPCDSTRDAEHKAVCNLVQRGVTVVAAAGNSAMPASYLAPAAYDEVIAVSAFADFDGTSGGNGTGTYEFANCVERDDDSFACFSNHGRTSISWRPAWASYRPRRRVLRFGAARAWPRPT